MVQSQTVEKSMPDSYINGGGNTQVVGWRLGEVPRTTSVGNTGSQTNRAVESKDAK